MAAINPSTADSVKPKVPRPGDKDGARSAAAPPATPLQTPARVSSGVPGLDIILNGGFLPGCTYLVEGVPGAGKTTLGVQFIVSGAVDFNEVGLIVTFEEFPQQIERDALAFGWDLRALENLGKIAIISTSPAALMDMMEEPEGPIDQLARSGPLKRVLVDSVTHFQSVASDPSHLRKVVFSFMNGLRRLGVTSLLTKEIERDDPAAVPFEEYLADGIIRLSNASLGPLRRMRCLEVLKSRGQPHLAGRSGFRFAQSGIEVFPRLSSNWASHAHWLPEADGALLEEQGPLSEEGPSEAPASSPAEPSAVPVRISLGVGGIDRMLGGGLLKGASALIAGTSGTGKTLLCLEFIHAGLTAGEPGVILTVEENAQKLLQFASSIGIYLAPHVQSGLLHIECCSPADVTPGEALWRLYRLVRSHSAGRVVIDSLSALFGGEFADSGVMQTSIQHLMHLFETMGITSLLTWEIQDITGDLRISDHGLSAIVDALILLRYVEAGSEMRRVLGVIKARGTDHDHQLREFRITPDGFKVECKLAGVSGLLRGSAYGIPKDAVEEIIQPLVFIKDMASMLRSGDLRQDQAPDILEIIAQEAERVRLVIRDRLAATEQGSRSDANPRSSA